MSTPPKPFSTFLNEFTLPKYPSNFTHTKTTTVKDLSVGKAILVAIKASLAVDGGQDERWTAYREGLAVAARQQGSINTTSDPPSSSQTGPSTSSSTPQDPPPPTIDPSQPPINPSSTPSTSQTASTSNPSAPASNRSGSKRTNDSIEDNPPSTATTTSTSTAPSKRLRSGNQRKKTKQTTQKPDDPNHGITFTHSPSILQHYQSILDHLLHDNPTTPTLDLQTRLQRLKDGQDADAEVRVSKTENDMYKALLGSICRLYGLVFCNHIENLNSPFILDRIDYRIHELKRAPNNPNPSPGTKRGNHNNTPTNNPTTTTTDNGTMGVGDGGEEEVEEQKMNSGIADFIFEIMVDNTPIRGLPVWEVKNDLIMDFTKLALLLSAASKEGGIVLFVDDRGVPRIHWPEEIGEGLSKGDRDLLESLLKQIFVEMHNNSTPTVILSSFQNYLIFHRTSPTKILISEIIRDTSPSVNTTYHNRDWKIFKMFVAVGASISMKRSWGGMGGLTSWVGDNGVVEGDIERLVKAWMDNQKKKGGRSGGAPGGGEGGGVGGSGAGVGGGGVTNMSRGVGLGGDGGSEYESDEVECHEEDMDEEDDVEYVEGKSNRESWGGSGGEEESDEDGSESENSGVSNEGMIRDTGESDGWSLRTPSTLPQPRPLRDVLDLLLPGTPSEHAKPFHKIDPTWRTASWTHGMNPANVTPFPSYPPSKASQLLSETSSHHNDVTNLPIQPEQASLMVRPRQRRSTPPYTISLYSLKSSGRLYDAYQSKYTVSLFPHDPSIKMAITKILDLSTFSCTHLTSSTKSEYTYTTTQAREAFVNDMCMYQHPLRLLQGKVVPEIYGIWSTVRYNSDGLESFLVCMEDVGQSMSTDELRGLSLDEKNAIIRLYTQIHNRGVAHRDVQSRHIRYKLDNGVYQWRLIDFEGAQLSEGGRKGIKLFDQEMVEVKRLLGV